MALTFVYKTDVDSEDITKTYSTYSEMSTDIRTYKNTIYSGSLSGSAADIGSAIGLFFYAGKRSSETYESLSDTLDVTNWDTSNLTELVETFIGSRFKHIVGLNVSSNITSLNSLFSSCNSLLDIDLSSWDTSNVTNMAGMFKYCSSLSTLDLSHLDTSKVTTFSEMFCDCSFTSIDVSTFNTSSATNLSSMFCNCSELTNIIGLANFDTSNVVSFGNMFADTQALTSLDISNWNTSNLMDLYHTFYFSGIQSIDLSSWDFRNVLTMEGMFYASNITEFSLNNKVFNYLTTVEDMFESCTHLTQISMTNLTGYNASTNKPLSVDFTEFAAVYSQNPGILQTVDFTGCTGFKVSDAQSMFIYQGALTTITNLMDLDFSDCTHLFNTFRECTSLTSLNLSKYAMTKLNSAQGMCGGCTSLTTINMTSWQPSSEWRYSANMFSDCSALTTIYCNIPTLSIYSSDDMFKNCTNLVGAIAYDPAITNAAGASCTSGYFTKCLEIEYTLTDTTRNSQVYSNYTELKQNITQNSQYKTYLQNVTLIGFSDDTDASNLFKDCTSLANISLRSFNPTNITNTSSMFENCTSLVTINVGAYSEWDKLSITQSTDMFKNCTSLVGEISYTPTITDITGANTDKYFKYNCIIIKYGSTEAMENTLFFDTYSAASTVFSNGMYDKKYVKISGLGSDPEHYNSCMYYSGTTRQVEYIDASDFKIPNSVTTLTYLFSNFYYLKTAIVPKSSTSNITSMAYLFHYDGNLINIEGLDNFDTSNVTSMDYMFHECRKLSQNSINQIFDWDTGNVTTMKCMFSFNEGSYSDDYCTYTLDLSNWDTSKVTNMERMFQYHGSEKSVFERYYSRLPLSIRGWDLSSLQYSYAMFYECGFGFVDARDIKLGPATYFMDMPVTEKILLDNSDASTLGTTTRAIFNECPSLKELDLSSWDLSNHTDFSSWFDGCTNLERIIFNKNAFASATNLFATFRGCVNLKYIDTGVFNTSNVTSFYQMFKNCSSLEYINLSSFDFSSIAVSHVNPLEGMFEGCTNLKHIWCSADLSNINTSWAVDMFKNCTSLSGIDGIAYDATKINNLYANTSNYFTTPRLVLKYNHIDAPDTEIINYCTNYNDMRDITNASTFNPTYFKMYGVLPDSPKLLSQLLYYNSFRQTSDNLVSADLRYVDMNNITHINMMFTFRSKLKSIKMPYSRSYDLINCEQAFEGCTSIYRIENIEYLCTENVTNMHSMFESCYNLRTLCLSYFNTSSCTNYNYMFQTCHNLLQLDLSGFTMNTSAEIISMSGMFKGCSSLSVIICDNNWLSQNPNTSDGSDPMFNYSPCIRGAIQYDSSKQSIQYANPTTGYFTPTGIHIEYTLKEDPSTTISKTFDTLYDSYVKLLSLDSLSGKLDTFKIYGSDTLVGLDWINSIASTLFKNVQTTNLESAQTFDVYRLYTENWVESRYLFSSCTTIQYIDISSWDLANVVNSYDMFNGCKNALKIKLNHISSESYVIRSKYMISCLNASSMFQDCERMIELEDIYMPNVITVSQFIYGSYNIARLNAYAWEAHNLYNLDRLAAFVYFIKEIYFVNPLNHSQYSCFDHSLNTYAYNMCSNCHDLTTIICNDSIISSNSNSVFSGCTKLVGAIKYDSSKITADYGNPHTGYFTPCGVAAEYKISNGESQYAVYDTISELKSSLTQNDTYKTTLTSCKLIYNFAASHVTSALSYEGIFDGCTALVTVDITLLNATMLVQSIHNMFKNCSALTTINCNTDYAKKANITSSESVFENCTSLVGAVSFDPTKINGLMANPKSGYFIGKGLTFYINGTECDTLYVNGVEMDSLYVNGVEIG